MMEETVNEAFQRAIRASNLSEAKFRLAIGADVGYKNEMGNDALYYAVTGGSYRIAEYLLGMGAKANEQYRNGKNLLHIAVEHHGRFYHSTDLAELLIKSGTPINEIDAYGNTPLWYACIYYAINIEMIRLLINSGANVNLKNKVGKSAYQIAEETKSETLLKLFE